MVVLQLGRTIYVLHALQMKSKKGIATTKQDVYLIRQRYKEAKELAEEVRFAGYHGQTQDLKSGKWYAAYGKECDIPGCNCDAWVEEIPAPAKLATEPPASDS